MLPGPRAVIGAVFGLIARLAAGSQRAFTSVVGMRAESYDVMVDDELADEAAVRLAR